ncbi:spermatogenesis-associated serine-rich protein 2 [Puntigrus tetrazona]|uniref:spermatogenesis-associated serine-rich protein 2 n=1 Tax=Puntigrus tetrazona TaxID=1606681 RepID=UPI001C895A5F|nr:spermatogenesis-associated serine-rich protein 2 [Puntigrus tetrazona]XP_043103010.1 spermatogenesis-associated serine-rich protein 2 [Puntigrus tetrazona]XP_043103012.1 spermatogenesis-associated serine-rich protein 2 [Puntigrus tetrazona]XP_043103013.1 spermatogenesis-associated serine-rich protein 2 [Puntigrus tetrazona]XP_043103014.1 spermatogenesis-associated serine-rich protein 2 [Puntigrus tetrazona]
MARKSGYKDVSGVVFDTHSKMVMSQGGTFEKMKEKINAVRAVVPNKSNNEIVLVLQHFENCVDRAVQAFVEGGAVEILKEWNVTGKKKPKKKKKPKAQSDAPTDAARAEAAPNAESQEPVNGFHANGSAAADGDSLDSLSEQLDSASLDAAELDSETAAPEVLEATGGGVQSMSSPALQPSTNHGPRQNQHRTGNKSQTRPVSSSYNPSVHAPPDDILRGPAGRKIGPNVDRSVKDLQRCAASLSRYRVVVRDEMDSSIKRMKQTFAELQSCLMDREVALLAEMDKVKAEALAILDGRQKRAEELKRLADQSASLTEEQLAELRADIKHFVSERKYDEDLGKAVKFSHDLEPLKCSIMSFGSVYHPQTGYSSRSRCSSTSSSVTGSAPAKAPPPPEVQHQASAYTGRPSVPHKQIFQGNRRIIHGYQGTQRYNGNAHPERNPGRSGYRYQSDLDSQPTNSARGSSHSSGYRSDRPAHNGLPQRQPRTHGP